MASRDTVPDQELADTIAGFYEDPLGYVMFMFPWDTEKSIQMVELQEPYKSRYNCKYGPDLWACKFLDDWGAKIKERGFDGEHAVEPIQFATTSGHGIGKTVLVAFIIKFILDTRPYSRGTVTAMTDTQLRTKTWAELGKWHKLSLTEHWFKYNTGRGAMSLTSYEHPQTWRCDAQTSREENSEAFAGQHAANATSFYIFDEASGVPDKIFDVREGGTTDGEPMTFDFGNPTRNSGRFFEECEGRFKHRFIVHRIDSRSVAITNKHRIQKWVEDYGEDSDYVKVRVRGIFPAAGTMQFIPTADVDAAMEREIVMDRSAPLLIGVDVARFGDDDSVIWARIGDDARSFPPDCYNGLDTVQLVGKIIAKIQFFRNLGMKVSGLFVDGGGVGGGVVDQLRALGYAPIEVMFGGGATDKNTYRFKSDEMWGNMAARIKTHLVLPTIRDRNGVKLKEQLTQREFGYTKLGNKVHLEAKADMKERLGSGAGSPDLADALATTFAAEVAIARPEELAAASRGVQDFDPFKLDWLRS
ncbi:MAG TPA: hypothetical protein VFE77_02980 [Rhodanobacter sp.]|nr:hypothetical protein [Rhodanobacter sp.]